MNQAEWYAPAFSIKIKGTELRHGVSVDVLSVSVTDTVDQADSFSFTIRDRHKDPGRFAGGTQLKWMDSDLFDEGNEVEIRMGYVNNLALEFLGEITAATASFPESGLPTLAVEGFGLYHMLQRRCRSKPFAKVKDSDIAKEIAKEVGLQAKVDATSVEYPEVPSQNATYDVILKQRAQRIGYEVAVKKKVLYFQKPRYIAEPSPALTLEWGKDLLSFNSRLSTYSMATEVTVRAPQTSQGKPEEPLVGKASAGDERVKMGKKTGTQIAKEVFGENSVLSDDHYATTQQEANEVALAHLEAKAMGFITGSGSCIGNPKLVARQVIELKGLGKRFSGKYYVISATHTIDAGGYRTDFSVKRNAR